MDIGHNDQKIKYMAVFLVLTNTDYVFIEKYSWQILQMCDHYENQQFEQFASLVQTLYNKVVRQSFVMVHFSAWRIIHYPWRHAWLRVATSSNYRSTLQFLAKFQIVNAGFS